jgi:hypothetical protein
MPCLLEDDYSPEQGVCCYTKDGKPRTCHIPWAALGEGTSHGIAAGLVKSNKLKLSCFDQDHGFVPNVHNSPNMKDEFRINNFNIQVCLEFFSSIFLFVCFVCL